MLEDLCSMSGKLSLGVYNFQLDKEKVAEYRIDKIPATLVEGEKDYDIRFYGMPAGYEFATLSEAALSPRKMRSPPWASCMAAESQARGSPRRSPRG